MLSSICLLLLQVRVQWNGEQAAESWKKSQTKGLVLFYSLIHFIPMCRGVSKYLDRYLLTKLPTSRTELFKQMLNGHI